MLFQTFSYLLLAQHAFTHVTANSQKQKIPDRYKIEHNGSPALLAEPPQRWVDKEARDTYGTREHDIPFLRLFHGNMKFFAPGQLNTPTGRSDIWGHENDNANQSACGIPDNAFFISKVAIHPYFLKYAGLDRFCQQDVCISFWREDGRSDMMLKVTDICSTDKNDPTHCATPADIKVDRTKANIMTKTNNMNDPTLAGDGYKYKVWWFFMKCWDDGIAQPAYLGNNWFTTPELKSNLSWAQGTALAQYHLNQDSYPAKGWQTYPNGGYNQPGDMQKNSPPIDDWTKGQPSPHWTPLAGGVGWGKKNPPKMNKNVKSNSKPKGHHKPTVNGQHQASTKAEKDRSSTSHHSKHHTTHHSSHTTKDEKDHAATTHHENSHPTSTQAAGYTPKPEHTSTHTSHSSHHSHSKHKSSSQPHAVKGYSPETTTSSTSHHGGKQHYGSPTSHDSPHNTASTHSHHSSHHTTHKKTKSKCSSVYPTPNPYPNSNTSTAGAQPYNPPTDSNSPPADTPADTPTSTDAQTSPADTPIDTPTSTDAGAAQTSPADTPTDIPTSTDAGAAQTSPADIPVDIPTSTDAGAAQTSPAYTPVDTPTSTDAGAAQTSPPACQQPVTVTVTNVVTATVSGDAPTPSDVIPGYGNSSPSDSSSAAAGEHTSSTHHAHTTPAPGYQHNVQGKETTKHTHSHSHSTTHSHKPKHTEAGYEHHGGSVSSKAAAGKHQSTATHAHKPTHTTAMEGYGKAHHVQKGQEGQGGVETGKVTQEKNWTESEGKERREVEVERRRIEPRYIERHKRRARSGRRHGGV
ncbi:hypothetical protein MMC30_008478 [Trapelia coarctata]|nr:hypothetical protein [Trapelia coarctata]